MSKYDGIAAKYGTPAYVYDLDVVAESRDQLFGMLPEGFQLFYALKSNPHPEIGRELRRGGCRAEISSTGELINALEAGFDPAGILYTGPGKTPGELEHALAAGVRLFSVESLTDLQHVGAAAQQQGVTASALLRVNTTASSGGTGIRMMGRPSQFGIDAETLPDLMPTLKAVPGTRVVGAHFFTMSNAQDEDALLGEYEFVLTSAARLRDEVGLPLEVLDIGGGFPARYDSEPPELNDYAKHIAAALAGLPYTQKMLAPAEGVAAAIERALTARHPRARYVTGANAKAQAFMARWTPRPVFDAVISTALGVPRKP